MHKENQLLKRGPSKHVGSSFQENSQNILTEPCLWMRQCSSRHPKSRFQYDQTEASQCLK